MTVRKIQSGRITTISANTYVGEIGTLFYNESLGDLRLSDAVTPGGIPLNVVGSGGSGNIWASLPSNTAGYLHNDGSGTLTWVNTVISNYANANVASYLSSGLDPTINAINNTISNVYNAIDGGGATTVYYAPTDLFLNGGGASGS